MFWCCELQIEKKNNEELLKAKVNVNMNVRKNFTFECRTGKLSIFL
jgi:hypothetical protein